jgi:hypothetical protein
LNEREKRVVIKDPSSSFTIILGGDPQGSVLSPLLFIIYINDIADKFTSLARLFADDPSLNCSHSDGTEIQSIINHDLKELAEWYKRFPFSLVNLKLNYTFQEVDGQLNALVKIQTEIHILALSFGDDYKRVYTLLFP